MTPNTDANGGVDKTAAAIGKKARKSKFAVESAARADPATEAARKGMAVAVFTPATGQGAPDLSNFEDKSLPMIVKPADMPIGASFIAKLVKVTPSTKETIKNALLEFVTSSHQRFAFPDVAVIHQALDGDAAKYIGHEIYVKFLGTKQGADQSRKPTRLFDVKVSREIVTYPWEKQGKK